MSIKLRVNDTRKGYSLNVETYADSLGDWTTLRSDRLYATSLCGNVLTDTKGLGWYRKDKESRSVVIIALEKRVLIGLAQITESDVPVIIDFLTKCVRTSPILIQMRAYDLRAVLQQIVNRSKHLEVVGNKLRYKK